SIPLHEVAQDDPLLRFAVHCKALRPGLRAPHGDAVGPPTIAPLMNSLKARCPEGALKNGCIEAQGALQNGCVEAQGALKNGCVEAQGALKNGCIEAQGALKNGCVEAQGALKNGCIEAQGAL